jgi:hypothetical protein
MRNIVRVKKTEDYEVILKYINTPFDDKNVSLMEEFKKVIEMMKNNNPHMYHAILQDMNIDIRDKLTKMLEI